ncbi:MAG: hypothetical protein IIC80_05890 [Chloroflexi bacterium]|nr:hypothetical protein [Chloroflexota bacterium]
MTRAIVLTSTFPRHEYVIGVLARRHDVVGVWQEEKSFQPERYAGSEEELRVVTEHFGLRDAAEADCFGEQGTAKLSPGTVRRRIPAGGINDPSEAKLMELLKPDVVLVFGTGILREPVLKPFEGRIINLHLGLSPYYRGSGTNFWPLVNREPEFVGATIHALDAGIDTGPIIAHVRPRIERGDGPHDIGNKAIRAAADLLADVAGMAAEGTVRSRPQWHKGRLYQRKHFNAEAVISLYRNFETGMIEEYLGNQAQRDSAIELVTLETVS